MDVSKRPEAGKRKWSYTAKKAAFGKYILIVGISIPVALGVNNLLLLSNLSEVSEGYKQASEMLYTPSLPVQIICLGIVIPIMEELIFRGLLFKRLREVIADGSGSDLFCAVFRIVSWKSGADYLWNNMRSSFGICL